MCQNTHVSAKIPTFCSMAICCSRSRICSSRKTSPSRHCINDMGVKTQHPQQEFCKTLPFVNTVLLYRIRWLLLLTSIIIYILFLSLLLPLSLQLSIPYHNRKTSAFPTGGAAHWHHRGAPRFDAGGANRRPCWWGPRGSPPFLDGEIIQKYGDNISQINVGWCWLMKNVWGLY